MKEISVTLSVKGGGKDEKIRATGQKEIVSTEVVAYNFSTENAVYTIEIYKDKAVIICNGDLSYRMILNSGSVHETTIKSTFGNIEAEIQTERLFIKKNKKGVEFEAEYFLIFQGFADLHKIRFSVEE